MKLYSWNVNGIRAVVNKGAFQSFVAEHRPDVLCLQETKAERGQAVIDLPDYHEYWNSAAKKGYSGTAIFTRHKPLAVFNGFPDDIMEKYDVTGDTYGDANKEGRVIATEFDTFYVVTVYTPNSKRDLSRLRLRYDHWDKAFLAYLKGLESGRYDLSELRQTAEHHQETHAEKPSRSQAKPVLFCGDLNVAHAEDDLAHPKPNIGKHGFTNEERERFQDFLDAGFIDTFRLFTQGNGHYSWWTHWANARTNNVGWRIDYWLASDSLRSKITNAQIHADVMGSDHCPVSLEIDV